MEDSRQSSQAALSAALSVPQPQGEDASGPLPNANGAAAIKAGEDASGVADLAAAIVGQGRGAGDAGAPPPLPSLPVPGGAAPAAAGGSGPSPPAAPGTGSDLPPHMYVDHTYYDYSVVSDDELRLMDENPALLPGATGPSAADARDRLRGMACTYGPMKKNAGGVVVPFPGKLMELLDRPDVEDVVRWMPHGESSVRLFKKVPRRRSD